MPKTFEEDVKKFKYSLRVKHDINEVIKSFLVKKMCYSSPRIGFA